MLLVSNVENLTKLPPRNRKLGRQKASKKASFFFSSLISPRRRQSFLTEYQDLLKQAQILLPTLSS